MANYSFDEKLKIVNQYLSNTQGGYKQLSNKYGIDTSMIRTWVRHFNLHGKKELQKNSQTFDGHFKIHVLNYMEEHGLSSRETAGIFNIGSHQSIIRWQTKRDNLGDESLLIDKRGRPPMNPKQPSKNQTIEEELNQLRMENAYLKKLISLSRKPNLKKKKLKLERFSNSRKTSK